ncbi:MAG: TolC family protein, partial [Chlamydiota bacterium]
MARFLILLTPLVLISCLRDAADPLSLAPSTSFSSWTPMKGNNLVSSRCCQTLLPPTFGEYELSLAELLDVALQNNPSTKQTWALARASAAQYGVALSPFFPNIGFNSFYFRQRADFPSTSTPSSAPSSSGGGSGGGANIGGGTFIGTTSAKPHPIYVTEAGPDIELTYTLFDFGQRTSAALAAKEALYYADLTHNQQIQTVLQTVMTDYYNYLFQTAVLRA